MKKEITIDVFHDERLLQKEQWLYHGMIFAPVDQENWLISELVRLRSGYDGFLHFVELRNPAANTAEGRKTQVAKKWAQFFANDTRHSRNSTYCNNFCALVVGINLNNLNKDCFGEGADQNIFKRFFRTTLLSGIRRFYSSDFSIVRVRRVFHGTQNLAEDNSLRWHPMWRIEREADGSIVFEHPELTLVAADHREERKWPQQSHVIQLADIVVGGFSQCLDCSSKARGCIEVARELQLIAQRLTKNPNNKNSKYYAKYSLSFFPSHRLSLEDLATIERYRSGFYTARQLMILDLHQHKLF